MASAVVYNSVHVLELIYLYVWMYIIKWWSNGYHNYWQNNNIYNLRTIIISIVSITDDDFVKNTYLYVSTS